MRFRRLQSPSERLPQIVPGFLCRKPPLTPDLPQIQHPSVLRCAVSRMISLYGVFKDINLYAAARLACGQTLISNRTTRTILAVSPVFAADVAL